jgi:hypothetical protein
MRRACLVVALSAFLTGAARAAPPMETNQLVDGTGAPLGVGGNPLAANPPATGAFSVARVAGIGTSGVLVSAADPVSRRTVTNTGSMACEIMPGAAAYGTGYPIAPGGSFTFDAAGRTTAAIYAACATSGGSVAVMSY